LPAIASRDFGGGRYGIYFGDGDNTTTISPTGWIDPEGRASLFELGTYVELNGPTHIGCGLQAHELLRHEYLVQQNLAEKGLRLPGNPSIALDLDHHTRGPAKDTRGIGGLIGTKRRSGKAKGWAGMNFHFP
jgi:hypothetical protein